MMKGTAMTAMVTVMKTRMRTRSRLLSLAPSAMSLGACFFSVSFRISGNFHVYLPRITSALFRKIKPAPVKTKSRNRDKDKEQDDEDGNSDSVASGPADSIMDSSSEEEADDEVDGMLGE
jgi:hypothetical protein